MPRRTGRVTRSGSGTVEATHSARGFGSARGRRPASDWGTASDWSSAPATRPAPATRSALGRSRSAPLHPPARQRRPTTGPSRSAPLHRPARQRHPARQRRQTWQRRRSGGRCSPGRARQGWRWQASGGGRFVRDRGDGNVRANGGSLRADPDGGPVGACHRGEPGWNAAGSVGPTTPNTGCWRHPATGQRAVRFDSTCSRGHRGNGCCDESVAVPRERRRLAQVSPWGGDKTGQPCVHVDPARLSASGGLPVMGRRDARLRAHPLGRRVRGRSVAARSIWRRQCPGGRSPQAAMDALPCARRLIQ